jgi:hypothetical protein
MTKATKEIQRKDGWNPPPDLICDSTTCRRPGEYQLTLIVNNSEPAPRIVALNGAPPIQVQPGDSIFPGPTVVGLECPSSSNYPVIDVEILSN